MLRRLWLLAIIPFLSCASALAQQQPAQQQQSATDPNGSDQQVFMPPPAAQTQKPASQNATTANSSAGASPTSSDDRIFFALPNFGTVEDAGHVKPLTIKQKFDIQWKCTFDPVEVPYVGLLAAISQATNSDSGYGQGASGYGKRYGAAFLDSMDENFMVGAIYPSLLREDPRYFQLGKGRFLHRAGYSVSRILITRTDAGNRSFNFSEILGSATGAAIGTTYRPADERHLDDAISDWGTQMGWDAVSNLMKEFWPDIRRELHHNS